MKTEQESTKDRKIIFLPIEKIEARYTVQWWKWFEESFDRLNKNVMWVGSNKSQNINTGQFLDVYNTNKYKLDQLSEVIDILSFTDEPVTIFLMDAWFPGLEVLAYIRDNTKKDIKIKGIFHAGTWDEYDYLSQNNCGKWAANLEQAWIKILDEIFVATEFHKKLIQDNRCYHGFNEKVKIVKFPVYKEQLQAKVKDLIVFPHRLAPEKNPQMFDELAKRLSYLPFEFIKTAEHSNDKKGFYELLKRSKFAVSFADQETFGISMLEAQNFGAIPIVPNKLSYEETIPKMYRYKCNNVDLVMVAANLIEYFIKISHIPEQSIYEPNVDNIVEMI